MPAPRHLPKYRHYKPKDLAVVRIDGRDVYLGKYDSAESHEKYRRVLAEWLSGGLAPGAPSARPPEVAAGPSVAEVILGFWKHAERHYRRPDGSPSEQQGNFRRTLRTLRQLYGSIPAGDFGPAALKAVRQAMIDAGMCRKTINQRVRRIVHVFGWAVESELIPGEVHLRLKAVRGLQRGRSDARETEPVRPVEDGAVDAIRPHVARQVWAMVQLQCLSGMRPGEVTALRGADLDMSGDVWTYTPAEHKTAHHGHERTIYLGPRAQAVLRAWLREDPAAYLFQPGEVMAEAWAARRAARRTPMTPSQRARKRKRAPARAPGVRYTTRSYYRAVRKGCEKAGVVPWHPHRLRHNAGTALRRDFGLEVARVVLGHTSPAVTETYAERDLARARAVMGEVG